MAVNCMKKWILCLVMGGSGVAWGASIPTLHEIEVDGVLDAIELSINDLELELNHEYLFVIDNKFSQSLSFNFEKFGQHVSTRYLQGSSSVTQESFSLLPHSKVVWHFTVMEPGNFSLCVVDPATMRESNKVKLVIPGAVEENAKETVKDVGKKLTQEAKQEAIEAPVEEEKKSIFAGISQRVKLKFKDQ